MLACVLSHSPKHLFRKLIDQQWNVLVLAIFVEYPISLSRKIPERELHASCVKLFKNPICPRHVRCELLIETFISKISAAFVMCRSTPRPLTCSKRNLQKLHVSVSSLSKAASGSYGCLLRAFCLNPNTKKNYAINECVHLCRYPHIFLYFPKLRKCFWLERFRSGLQSTHAGVE
jgi:hypothetical protein